MDRMTDSVIENPQSVGTPPPGRHRWTLVVVILLLVGILAWWLFPKGATAPGALLPDGGVSLTAESSVSSVTVGTQFSADIVMDGGSYAVTAADIIVSYDPQVLTAVRIVPGPFLPVELAGGSVQSGNATITVASGTTPVTGSGVIASLTFQAIAPGDTTVAVVSGSRVSAAEYPGDVVGKLVPASISVH